MRLHQLAQLVLLLLLGHVRRSEGEGTVDIFRYLDQNITEGQEPGEALGEAPGDLSGFNDPAGAGAGENGTEPIDAPPTPEGVEEPMTPPVDPTNPENPAGDPTIAENPTNITIEQNTPPGETQEEEMVETENPNPEEPEVAASNPPVVTEQSESNPPQAETIAPTGDDEFEEEVDDEFEGDDMYDEEEEEEYEEEEEEMEEMEGEGEEEWFEPEVQETKAPYVPPTGDDPFAEQPDESEWANQENWKQETPEEMMHDKNVIIAVSCAVVLGFVMALCTAQQVIENPDGCCAGICRCCVKFFCFFFKILCFPCRMCCGNKDRRTHDLMVGGGDSYTHDLELT